MGYAPLTPFSDGLKATIEWYAANRDWWEPLHRPAPPARPRGRKRQQRPSDPLAGHRRGRNARPRPDRRCWPARGEEFTALTRADLDITDAAAVATAVASVKPDVVVNCAAWTAVDAAEEHEAEALAINGQRRRPTWPPPARASARCSSTRRPTTSSTATRPPRTPRTRRPRPPAPTAAPSWPASRRCAPPCRTRSYVVRTAWLYGAHGKNFVKTMLRLARNGTAPGVVADQHGQPTWTADVAAQIYALIDAVRPGGHLPRDQFGPDDLVRLRRGDLPPVPRPGRKSQDQRYRTSCG